MFKEDDYFRAKYGDGNVKRKFTSTPELEKHIRDREFYDPATGEPHKNKKGIVGAHNEKEFYKNDVKVVDSNKVYDIYGREVKGITQVEYSVPELDAKTRQPTGNYNQKTNTKTIYDPEIISDGEYIRSGLEAAEDALAKESSGVLPIVWSGVDSKSVSWIGYFRNGKIDSFFPATPNP